MDIIDSIKKYTPEVARVPYFADKWIAKDVKYLVAFPAARVDSYLSLFIDYVNEDYYKPLDRGRHLELTNCRSMFGQIIFGVSDRIIQVCLQVANTTTGYTTNYPFSVADGSFGAFLLNLFGCKTVINPVVEFKEAEKKRTHEMEKEITNTHTTQKEDKNIMNKGLSFDFGVCDTTFRMSPYGLAVQNAKGDWVSYDKENNCIMSVEILNFEAPGLFYKLPIGLPQVQIGDVIIHCCKPNFVTAVNTDSTLTVVDPVCGDIKSILPTKSPFGFNFVTKIVCLLDNMATGSMAPTADNPFGGMGMYMAMSSLINQEGKSADNMKSILPFILMGNMGTNSNNNNFINNPMLLAFMLK